MRLASLVCMAQSWPLLRKWPLDVLANRLRKQLRLRRATAMRLRRDAAIAAHGMVQPSELLEVVAASGIRPGDVVFVQISFNDMPTFAGTPASVLKLLRDLVGPSGTLLMPAYTDSKPSGDGVHFDVRNTPTYTGIVCELFRRSPGVLRSTHPRHSMCGMGPLAHRLLADHESCALADGAGSPFDKIRLVPAAKILTLGLPPGFISFLHWLEDIEPASFPWQVHQSAPTIRTVRREDQTLGSVPDLLRRESVACRLDYPRVARMLSPNAMRHFDFKSVPIGIYDFKVLTDELIELRRQGIVHYS